jgi:predicted deacylase
MTDNPLAPYPSPEGRDRELERLAAAAGAEVHRLGQSVEGRPILAARVPQLETSGQTDARVLVTANIHGPEYVSGQVALGLLARIGAHEGLRRLRYRSEVWVVPCVNPDGYARTWERRGVGRVGELRVNAHGVDLNRNFPLPPRARRLPLPGAGSSQAGAATYVGAHPLSEPETAAVAALLDQHRFDAAVGCHSFMGRVIPPFVRHAPTHATYAELARALAGPQRLAKYRRLATRWFDTFTGELEDFQHHVHGIWAVCLETFSFAATFRQHLFAPSTFWRFNPRDPEPWVENDVPAVAAFLNAALDLRRRATA